jgi:hypothetical protein
LARFIAGFIVFDPTRSIGMQPRRAPQRLFFCGKWRIRAPANGQWGAGFTWSLLEISVNSYLADLYTSHNRHESNYA